LLISTYADNSERLRQNLAALEAAKAAGVSHILYTSFLSAGPDALSEHSQLVHWPTEQAIAGSGLSYTILRHALYAEILVADLDDTLASAFYAAAEALPPAPISRATISGSPRRHCLPAMGARTAFSTRRWNVPTPATRWPRRSRAASASRSVT
jgi:hypothetical protein